MESWAFLPIFQNKCCIFHPQKGPIPWTSFENQVKRCSTFIHQRAQGRVLETGSIQTQVPVTKVTKVATPKQSKEEGKKKERRRTE
jgi:hypothetical protein